MFFEPTKYNRDGGLCLCKTRIHPQAILTETEANGEYEALIQNYLLPQFDSKYL